MMSWRAAQHNIHVRAHTKKGNINTPLELAIQIRRSSLAWQKMQSTEYCACVSLPPTFAKRCSAGRSRSGMATIGSASSLSHHALSNHELAVAGLTTAHFSSLGSK